MGPRRSNGVSASETAFLKRCNGVSGPCDGYTHSEADRIADQLAPRQSRAPRVKLEVKRGRTEVVSAIINGRRVTVQQSLWIILSIWRSGRR